MSITKFQHYVPRFYLNCFCSSTRKIYVFDKTSQEIFPSSIDRIGGEKYFYESLDTQVSKSSQQTMEYSFGKVESATAPIFKQWVDRVENGYDLTCSEEERWQTSLFLSLQIFRTLEQRKLFGQFLEAINYKKTAQVSESYSSEELRDYGNQLLYDAYLVDDFTEQIFKRIWVFAANFSGVDFYTSDNPVQIKSYDNKLWRSISELKSEGSQIIFPISPHLILYAKEPYYWNTVKEFDGKLSPVVFTEYMAKHENSGQVGFSTRFVYAGSDNFEFAKMYCDLHPEICDPERQRFVW